jgi:hypothetical protein
LGQLVWGYTKQGFPSLFMFTLFPPGKAHKFLLWGAFVGDNKAKEKLKTNPAGGIWNQLQEASNPSKL